MKTLLTIAGNTYLLPTGADAATILKQLSGAVRLKEETHYGPGDATSTRYGDEYFSARVLGDRRESVRVELVDEADVCSQHAWEQRCAASNARIEAAKAKAVNVPVNVPVDGGPAGG